MSKLGSLCRAQLRAVNSSDIERNVKTGEVKIAGVEYMRF